MGKKPSHATVPLKGLSGQIGRPESGWPHCKGLNCSCYPALFILKIITFDLELASSKSFFLLAVLHYLKKNPFWETPQIDVSRLRPMPVKTSGTIRLINNAPLKAVRNRFSTVRAQQCTEHARLYNVKIFNCYNILKINNKCTDTDTTHKRLQTTWKTR
jgi:hypothetical protein